MTAVEVPSFEDFSDLAVRVANLEENHTNGPDIYLRPGDGDAVLASAMHAVLDGNGTVVTKRLVFMPGVYTFSSPLIPASISAGQIDGLTIAGAVPGTVSIKWTGSGSWIDTANTRFRNLTIRDLGFVGSGGNLVTMISTGAPYNNKWLVENVDFSGKWNYAFGIGKPAGAAMNLNSELVFRRVSTAPSTVFADAFMHCGLSNDNSENQSLDHSFYDCNFSLSSGMIWNYPRGGSVHVYGGSCSAASSAGNITWINLPGSNANNPKVNQYQFTGVFFEPKSANHLVINCERADGNVTFRDCEDLSSLQQGDPSGVNAYRLHRYKLASPWGSGVGATGPVATYENHVMVGRVRVDCGGGTQKLGGFRVSGTKAYNGLSGQTVVATGATASHPLLDIVNGSAQYAVRENYNVPSLSNWS